MTTTAASLAEDARAAHERRDLARHTRAIAQAQAAGITGLRDLWTMSA